MADVPKVEKNDIDLSPMSGNIDPNAQVHGKKGQLFTQVKSDNTVVVWVCVGGTVWK